VAALRAIAGLLPITDGQIRFGDEVWDEPTRAFRSADRRPIEVVFQDYLLFDHLSALENVAFGLRAREIDKRVARADALRWLPSQRADPGPWTAAAVVRWGRLSTGCHRYVHRTTER
jgi:ABC-type sulfate/molybdate transport systems ATPase subunit